MSEPHLLLRRAPAAAGVSAVQPMAEALARALRTGLRPLGLLGVVEAGPSKGGASLAAVLERGKGSVAALFSLQAPAGLIAILLDPALVFAATEAMLGGDGREPPHIPQRSPTRIELRIARIVAEQAARSLQACLDDLYGDDIRAGERSIVNAGCEKLETNLDFLDLGPQSGTVTVLALKIELLGREGSLSLIVPDAVSAILQTPGSAMPVAAAAVADPDWTSRLNAGIGQTDIRIEARFEHQGLTLGDIAGLKLGQMLDLSGAGGALIVESSGEALFTGRLGQADGRYAVRIEQAIDGAFQLGTSA